MSDSESNICYVRKEFKEEHLKLIHVANRVIEQYQAQGLSLTLRQLYYQMVTKNILANKDSEYKRLGGILSDARLAGLVSWSAIEDRTRYLRGLQTFDSIHEPFESIAAGYRRDLWDDQSMRPEVWIEKDALVGVIAGICNELRVDFFACRGYNSQSEQWRAGQRMARYIHKGQRPIIFHLGDHDPSGIDMTRDNRDRLSLFAGVPVQVVRLALNYSQIEMYKPPPNPTKLTDSRATDYISQHGYSCWELDALEPSVIAALISDSVAKVRDPAKWDVALAREADDRETIRLMVESLE